MSEVIALAAEARERAGKGTARQTRRDGLVPAVIYGNKQPPVMIALEKFALNKQLHRPGFFTHLYDLQLDGKPHRVLARDVQFDPVSDAAIHVDFLRVTASTQINVEVPVEFTNTDKSPGIKRGGVLNIVLHEVELLCRADAIPEHITVDVSAYDIGDSIHISAVTLPAGVKPADSAHDFTIATIVAPTVSTADEAADEATAAADAPAAPAAAT